VRSNEAQASTIFNINPYLFPNESTIGSKYLGIKIGDRGEAEVTKTHLYHLLAIHLHLFQNLALIIICVYKINDYFGRNFALYPQNLVAILQV
jgi:hypothetical protein